VKETLEEIAEFEEEHPEKNEHSIKNVGLLLSHRYLCIDLDRKYSIKNVG